MSTARLARRGGRPNLPEVFGLSTLDTVTCALGGAIILMIFMASFTEPDAPVQIADYRVIKQAGREKPSEDVLGAATDESALQLSNIATVFFDFGVRGVNSAGVDPKPRCEDRELHAPPDVSLLKPPEAHYDNEGSEVRWALVAWAKPPSECREFTIKLRLGSTPPPCRATLVSGANVQTRTYHRQCPSSLTLRASDATADEDRKVYRFSRLP